MASVKDFFSKVKDWYNGHRLLADFVALAIIYLFCCFFEYASAVALVLLLFFMFREKNIGGFYYLVMTIPFARLLVFANFVYVFLVATGIYIVYLFIKSFVVEKRKINTGFLIIFLLLEIYLALPIVNNYDLTSFVTMGVVLILYMLFEVFRDQIKTLSFRKIIYSFLFGFILSVFFTVFKPVSPLLQTLMESYVYNGYTRFVGLTTNPNTFSLICVFGMLGPIYLLFNEKYKILSVIMLIFMYCCGLATLSKSFLILSSVWICFIILKLFILSPKKAFLTLGVALVVFMLAFLFFKDFMLSILSRFISATEIKDISEFNWSQFLTFRNDLWGAYLTAIFQSPRNLFFGLGISEPRLPGLLNPHNVYIGVVYHVGIVGFVLFAIFFVYSIANIFRKIRVDKKVDWLVYVEFIILLMVMFVEDFIF